MDYQTLSAADYVKGDVYARGKTNILYNVLNDPKIAIFQYGDTIANNDDQTFGKVPGKGALNCEMSAICFDFMRRMKIPTHFVGVLSETESVVQKTQALPFEVIVRNAAAGSFIERFDPSMEAGTPLKCALLEFTMKAKPKDFVVADWTPVALGLITDAQARQIVEYAELINKSISKFLAEIGYYLVDFKLEFGITDDGCIAVIDEFSFDTFRLLNKATGKLVDKADLYGVEKSCDEWRAALKMVSSQIGWWIDQQTWLNSASPSELNNEINWK